MTFPLRDLKQLWNEFGRDKAGQMSAAFAYAAVFSIGPLLLVLISVAGFMFGQQAIEGQLFGQLREIVGSEAARNVQAVIAHIRQSDGGVGAFIVGSIGTLLGAAALTNQLQDALNTIFQAVPDPKAGIKATVYAKIKNIVVVLIGGLVGVASVVLSVVVAGLGDNIGRYVVAPPLFLELLNAAVSFAVFVVVLYLIYRLLPDVVIPRRVALSTAGIIATLFVIGKIVLGLVIGHNSTASAYGAAASVIVLLLWFYYVAQILLLGAEGIKVYALRHKLALPAKRFTLKHKSFDVYVKNDWRGRMLDAFSRGYRGKSKK